MSIDSKIEEITSEDLNDRNEVITIEQEDADKADDLLSKIETFLDVNKEAGKKDDEEKTKLYGEVKSIWKELTDHINNIGFNFNINEDEYKQLRKYILSTCVYDHQTVFMGVQLKGDFFKRAETHRKNGEIIKITCNESILIHHLFETGGFTVKGLDFKAYNYRNIVTAIGNVNKIYKELDVASTRAGSEINNWVQGLDSETIEAEAEIQEG